MDLQHLLDQIRLEEKAVIAERQALIGSEEEAMMTRGGTGVTGLLLIVAESWKIFLCQYKGATIIKCNMLLL